MPRYGGFQTREGVVRVLDLASLPEFAGKIGKSPAVHPAYLSRLPDEKVARSIPERDPAQTNRIHAALHD